MNPKKKVIEGIHVNCYATMVFPAEESIMAEQAEVLVPYCDEWRYFIASQSRDIQAGNE